MQKAEMIDFGDGTEGQAAPLGESRSRIEDQRPLHGQKLNEAFRKLQKAKEQQSLVVIKGKWNRMKEGE